MGYSYAGLIQQAAEFILQELNNHASLTYSELYDGSEQTSKELALQIRLEKGGLDSPEHLIDLAVAQLEEMGIVITKELESKLADDTHDYVIRWAERGQSILAAGKPLTFRDME